MATKLSEFDLVEAVPKELTCCICIKVLCEPHLMNCCEQQFCKKCLEEWLQRKNACPHCRSRNYTHVLMQQTNRKIRELKVYCPNKQHGCKNTLKISECEEHLSTTDDKGCLYVKLKCPNSCSIEVIRKEMKTHTEKDCPRRSVCCAFCKLRGEYQIITGQHIKECPLSHGCSEIVPHKTLEETSPLEPCPFEEFGCESKVCLKDMDQHMKKSLIQHLTDLAKSHSALKAEQAKLSREQASLKEDCSQLEKAMEAVEPMIPCDRNTSSLTLGESVNLVLSESNQASGHHCITLSLNESLPNIKFRVEWEVKKTGRWSFNLKIFCTHCPNISLSTESLKFTVMVEGVSADCVYTLPQGYSEESGKLLGTLSLPCQSEEKNKLLTMSFQSMASSRNETVEDVGESDPEEFCQWEPEEVCQWEPPEEEWEPLEEDCYDEDTDW